MELHGAGVAGFQKRAAGVAGELFQARVIRVRLPPAGESLDDEVRMVLAEIVEMIGNGKADVIAGIAVEFFQQPERRVGRSEQFGEVSAPWEKRAAAFGNEAAHVLVGVFAPGVQLFQRALADVLSERPDRELAGETIRHFHEAPPSIPRSGPVRGGRRFP